MAYIVDQTLCDKALKEFQLIDSRTKTALANSRRKFLQWKKEFDSNKENMPPELIDATSKLEEMWEKASLTKYTFNDYVLIGTLNQVLITFMADHEKVILFSQYLYESSHLRQRILLKIFEYVNSQQKDATNKTDVQDGATTWCKLDFYIIFNKRYFKKVLLSCLNFARVSLWAYPIVNFQISRVFRKVC